LDAVVVKVKGFMTSGGVVQPTRSVDAAELALAALESASPAKPIAPADAALSARNFLLVRCCPTSSVACSPIAASPFGN